MVEYSEFDSLIFGKTVGRVNVEGLTSSVANKIRQDQLDSDLDLVFIQDSNFDFCSSHVLPWDFLRLSDVKIRLVTQNFPSASCEMPGLRFTDDYRSEDVPALLAMVSQIATLSQYCRHFGKAAALDLYSKWVMNSLSGEVADYSYFVRSEKTNRLVGFVALQLDGSNAEATLVAVDSKFRGKGLGQFILKNVLFNLYKLKIKNCFVGTQLTNRSAIAFYNSLGFRFDSYRVDLICGCIKNLLHPNEKRRNR